MTEYRPLLVKRSIRSLEPGDIIVRRETGERCELLEIMHDTSMPVGCTQTLRYRFYGFDVLHPCMVKMFDIYRSKREMV